MWNDLSQTWKRAFEEAWNAFIEGSVPIGAVLADENGEVLMSERNRSNEKATLNRRISHAEANLLRKLDTSLYDCRKLTLFSTMEPCPMCMGTILMANIKNVHSAARDPYCGMTHLCRTEPYYIDKCVNVGFAEGESEFVQLVIQSYFELRALQRGGSDTVFKSFEKYSPRAADKASLLFRDRVLDELADRHENAEIVYDIILSEE